MTLGTEIIIILLIIPKIAFGCQKYTLREIALPSPSLSPMFKVVQA
jgi:hypothetical protein